MLKRQTLRGVVWVDLDSPTSEEIKQVMNEYAIHPLVAEDLLAPTARPRIDVYERFIYMVLHFPALRHTHSLTKNQEVDFLIGKDFLITAHYDTIDPLHKFAKIFEVNSILESASAAELPVSGAPERESAREHAGFIFFALIRKLYRAVIHELEFSGDALREVEERIFHGREKQMVVEISKVGRDLLNIKQSLAPHRDLLEQFRDISAGFFGESFAYHTKTILHENSRVRMLLENALAILDELRETNNSLVSTRQNEVMQVLTIMAFVTFPLSLIANIFSMSTTYLPFAGHPYDFWIVIGIMAAITICFFGYFKYKKWL